MNPEIVSTAVDLSNCDKEPIHIPGHIQSHGYLLAADKDSQVVYYASENIKELGMPASWLLGKTIKNFITLSGLQAGKADVLHLVQYGYDAEPEDVNPVSVYCNGQPFHLIISHSGNFVLLELEPAELDTDQELQRLMGVSLSRILEAKSLQQTLHYAARQVKDIIHYDRVMVYQFWEDGHGEVVGEEKNEELEPFMGLHYPASDIPKQARELYVLNQVRIIADVNSTPAALLAVDAEAAAKPLDLTHSVLRAVSPIHVEYLKNMGVKSSFSISIVIKDKLWGLIACHNYTPKLIDYKARNSGKLIGKILSSALQYREETERKETTRQFQLVLQDITKAAIKDWNIADSLVNHSSNFLQLAQAGGAALLFANELYVLGETPAKEEIYALYKWLRENHRTSLYHTNRLPAEYPAAASYKDIASGLLGCSLSWEMNEFIMWFKPELKKMVNWAGNPNKPAETDGSGNMEISPRRSFETWSEEVKETSAPWSPAEIASVMKLREEILHIINEKANQIRRLNEELKKAYEELDTFSYTISHDLKTPLASIKNYTEILLEDSKDLTEDTVAILGKIVKSTDRMDLLIREVLSYSRIGRLEVESTKLDMKNILENTKNDILTAYPRSSVVIHIGYTPAIWGDEIMMSQVFGNLVGNAVKYSDKAANPKVIIEGQKLENEILYSVKDNGIGIDMRSGNEVFELFRRLHNARSYEGTGVGLAIVKRIIEKHQGKIWYESEPDAGTTFYISFKKINEAHEKSN